MDTHAVRAALYARVSTVGQAEKYGLEAQRRMLRERAQQRRYTVVPDGDDAVFADDESGSTLDRPAWRRVERLAEQGAIDVLLTVDPDRLSRDLTDMLMLDRRLTVQGVRPEFVSQEFDASPQGRLFFQMRGAFAEYERNIIRERTARGRREKAAQGKIVNWRTLPCWLRVGPDAVTVELVPKWSEIVRQVFRWFTEEGLSVYAIARRLTEMGVAVPSGRGTRWQATTVHTWLRGTTAMGEYRQLATVAVPPRRPQPGAAHHHSSRADRSRGSAVSVPSVVSKETWARAQGRLEANARFSRRNGKRSYLLQGLLFCAGCGRRMAGFAETRTGTRRYRCGSAWNPRVDGRGCPTPASVKADWIEADVWDRISHLFLEPDTLRAELVHRQDADSPTRDAVEKELSGVEIRLAAIPVERSRIIDQVAKGSLTDDDVAGWSAKIRNDERALGDRRAALQADLAAMTASASALAGVLSFADRVRQGIGSLDDEGRSELLRQVVRRVTVVGTGRTEPSVIDTVLPIGPQPPSAGSDAQHQLDSLNRERVLPVRPAGEAGDAVAPRSPSAAVGGIWTAHGGGILPSAADARASSGIEGSVGPRLRGTPRRRDSDRGLHRRVTATVPAKEAARRSTRPLCWCAF